MRAKQLSTLLLVLTGAALGFQPDDQIKTEPSCDGGLPNLTTGGGNGTNLTAEEVYYQSLPFDPFDRTVTVDTLNYVPDLIEAHIKTLIESQGGAGDLSIGVDYSVYERFFPRKFLLDLVEECKWIEQKYERDFIDSNIKRADKKASDGDYANYHRISQVYWLTFIKEEDYEHLPNILRFKKWVKLFEASINKMLFETGHQFEVASIEEQYLRYDKGGKFEAHLDTQCNPLTSCTIGKDHHYPRLLTWLVFLNPNWTEEDGGLY